MKNICALLLLFISTALHAMHESKPITRENVDWQMAFKKKSEQDFLDYVQQKIGVSLSQPLSLWASAQDVRDRKNQLLLIACEYNYISAIKILLQLGANINTCNPKNYSPLHYAVEKRNTKLAQFLLDHGANINALGPRWEHPLQTAVKSGDTEMVLLLLKNHCQLNMCHYLNYSPLEQAIRNDYPEVVEILLSHGAKVLLRHISVAKEHNRTNILLMLEKNQRKGHTASCALL